MEHLSENITIKLDESLYLKNPESSELGKLIICNSIEMIYENGFDEFTFKKLANEIHSSEASIYRYFENKQTLLLYLINWFWLWFEYNLDLRTSRSQKPKTKLSIAIKSLVEDVEIDSVYGHIDEKKLYHIVVSEVSKSFFKKTVEDKDNHCYYHGYLSICNRIAELIRETNPNYKYPKALSSSIVELVFYQKFMIENIPIITDARKSTLKGFVQSLLKEVIEV